jgi:ubiquitin C-terminal hydrolase
MSNIKITPKAVNAYLNNIYDSLYVQETKSSNGDGHMYKIGTVDSKWERFTQIFSSCTYSRGKAAKIFINQHPEIKSLMVRANPTVTYSNKNPPDNKDPDLYLRKNETTQEYKVGTNASTWKKIKHWFKSIFNGVEYLYGQKANEELKKISTFKSQSIKTSSSEEESEDSQELENTTDTPLSDSTIAQWLFIDELDRYQSGGPDFEKIQQELNQLIRTANENPTEQSNQGIKAIHSLLTRMKNTCQSYHDNEGTDSAVKEKLGATIKGFETLLEVIPSNIKGIKNITNSCYMNSAMQALMAVPMFCDSLKALNLQEISESYKNVATAAKNFVEAYSNIKEAEDMTPYASELRQALFDANIIDSPDEPEGVSTEDLLELCKSVYGATTEEEIKNLMEFLSFADKINPIETQQDPMVVLDALMDILNNKIHLGSFEMDSTQDPHLPLPMKTPETGKSLKFTELLDDYLIKQEDIETNKTGDKQIITGNPPPYMIIQLFRLQHVNIDGELTQTRNLNPVEVNPNQPIDFGPYCLTASPETSLQYEFVAGIRHLPSGTGGHYIATVKDATGKWIKADDSRTSPLNPAETLAELENSTIYILKRAGS